VVGNAFDPSVMPSSRAARKREWSQSAGLWVYSLIVAVISVAILGIVALA
jgi:hypothetical protein